MSKVTIIINSHYIHKVKEVEVSVLTNRFLFSFCVVLHRWMSSHCDVKRPFVCEFKAVQISKKKRKPGGNNKGKVRGNKRRKSRTGQGHSKGKSAQGHDKVQGQNQDGDRGQEHRYSKSKRSIKHFEETVDDRFRETLANENGKVYLKTKRMKSRKDDLEKKSNQKDNG